jgi:hypothetical protein
METKKKKPGPQNLKEKRDSPSRRSLQEIRQQGAGSYSAPLRGPAATSEPDVEISANGRDEPGVRNLPEVKPETSLLGVSSSDIPLQGASRSSTPTVREDLGQLVSGVGGLCLEKKTLSGSTIQKLKKTRARASEARTGGIQQPGNAGAPKQ